MKRIGPRMLAAHVHVLLNPGCCKLDVAREVGPNGSTYYGYRTVDRAIAAGLIKGVQQTPGGRYTLYACAAHHLRGCP